MIPPPQKGAYNNPTLVMPPKSSARQKPRGLHKPSCAISIISPRRRVSAFGQCGRGVFAEFYLNLMITSRQDKMAYARGALVGTSPTRPPFLGR